MKQVTQLLILVALATISLALTACDSDDEYIADTLWGTWEGDMYVSSEYNGQVYDATYSVIQFDRNNGSYASGTGYWIDYYSNAPWDYVANHITWEVYNGCIHVYFIEEGSSLDIYNYWLDYDYFNGCIYNGYGQQVDFSLQKTGVPTWSNFYYGYDYWLDGYYSKSRATGNGRATEAHPRRIVRME